MSQTIVKSPAPHAPSAVERAVGILFAFLVLALIAALTILEIDVRPGMQQLLNVLLALMAAAVAATIPGFVNVSYSAGGLALRAAGGAAVMLTVMWFLAQPPVAAAQAGATIPPAARLPAPAKPAAAKPAAPRPVVSEPVRYEPARPQQSLWRAESRCGWTGAMGWATSPLGPQDAQIKAVQACVLYGGLPECCASDVRLSW